MNNILKHWDADDDFVPPPRPWVNLQELNRFRDTFVRACCDIVCVSGDDVLLGLRRNHPHRGWWLIGGAIAPHETPQRSACNHFRDEFSLDVEPSLLSFVGTYSMCWPTRYGVYCRHKGTHDVSMVFAFELDDRDLIHALFVEFSEVRWIPVKTIAESNLGPVRFVDQLKEIVADAYKVMKK